MVGNLLLQKGFNIKTKNFGVGGQNLHQSTLRYISFIEEIRPDYVFVMHEANDISKLMKGGYYVKESSLHNSYDSVNTKTGGLQNMNAGAGGNEIYVCTNNKPSIDTIAINAAFVWGQNKKLYFFQGDDYWEYNNKTGQMGENYPKKIKQFWGEIPKDIDAVFTWGFNNKTYFFKGSKVSIYEDKKMRMRY